MLLALVSPLYTSAGYTFARGTHQPPPFGSARGCTDPEELLTDPRDYADAIDLCFDDQFSCPHAKPVVGEAMINASSGGTLAMVQIKDSNDWLPALEPAHPSRGPRRTTKDFVPVVGCMVTNHRINEPRFVLSAADVRCRPSTGAATFPAECDGGASQRNAMIESTEAAISFVERTTRQSARRELGLFDTESDHAKGKRTALIYKCAQSPPATVDSAIVVEGDGRINPGVAVAGVGVVLLLCLSSGLLFHYRRSISGKAHSWVASKVFGAPCVTTPTPDKSSRSSDVTVEIPNAKQQLEAARARARLTSLADGGDGKTSSTSCNPPPMLKRQSSSRGSRIGQMLERMTTKSNSYASLEERLSLSVAGLEVNVSVSPAGSRAGSRSQSKADLSGGGAEAVADATAASGPSS